MTENEKTTNLIFKPPSPDEPGYLRRARKAVELMEELQKNPTVKLMDDLVEFLADYVAKPSGRTEAREALLDASRAQFREMLTAISGGENDNPLA